MRADLPRALNALRELELGVSTHADRERAARVHLWLLESEGLRAEVADLRRRIRLARKQLGRDSAHGAGYCYPKCEACNAWDALDLRKPLPKGRR